MLRCASLNAALKTSILRARQSNIQRFSQTISARSNPYPFPTSSNPTPYQIFHLLPDASPAEVKQRYYELVRLYHPDSAECRKHQPDSTLRHSHFSAISKAYESIQKRAENGGSNVDGNSYSNPWKRSPHVSRSYREEAFMDEGWKEKLIWAGLCASLLTVGVQYALMRQNTMKDVSAHIRRSTPLDREGLSRERRKAATDP